MNRFLARSLIYPLQEAILQRPTFRYLAELEHSQWLSREQIEHLQTDKLKSLLLIASAHCPWHAQRMREAGLDPSDPSFSLKDLRKLPIMNKEDASSNQERITWHEVPGGAYKYNTGGSSGQPLIFYYGRWRQASDAAGRMRARRWWGVEVGDPEVYLWGAPVELAKTDRIKTLRDRLVNQLVLNAFDMSIESMDNYIEAIRQFKPRCMYGYASSIALLAAHIQDRNIKITIPGLRVICTTGEPLFPDQRELISNVFGVPVANEYGSRDIGFTAHESPEGQMLQMSESIILEILDSAGQPVDEGELGEAVMTGLCSQAQPFIRYRTGDMIRKTNEASKDGRGLHVLGEVTGRSTDFVVKPDGTIMHALSIIYVLRAIDGIAEFKFIQHATDHTEVLIVPNNYWNNDSHNQIVHGVNARMGKDIHIDIKLVDSIPPEASGKYRYVISHVDLPSGLVTAQDTSPH